MWDRTESRCRSSQFSPIHAAIRQFLLVAPPQLQQPWDHHICILDISPVIVGPAMDWKSRALLSFERRFRLSRCRSLHILLNVVTCVQCTQEALNAGEFHLVQRAPAATLCWLGVDFNDPNPDRPDFGAFTIDDDIPGNGPVATAGELYRVIARNGLRLREGPGFNSMS
jgi:hypothetical protein